MVIGAILGTLFKLKRMGLRVVFEKSAAKQTTTRELIPGDLLTHEEILRISTGALAKAHESPIMFSHPTTYLLP